MDPAEAARRHDDGQATAYVARPEADAAARMAAAQDAGGALRSPGAEDSLDAAAAMADRPTGSAWAAGEAAADLAGAPSIAGNGSPEAAADLAGAPPVAGGASPEAAADLAAAPSVAGGGSPEAAVRVDEPAATGPTMDASNAGGGSAEAVEATPAQASASAEAETAAAAIGPPVAGPEPSARDVAAGTTPDAEGEMPAAAAAVAMPGTGPAGSARDGAAEGDATSPQPGAAPGAGVAVTAAVEGMATATPAAAPVDTAAAIGAAAAPETGGASHAAAAAATDGHATARAEAAAAVESPAAPGVGGESLVPLPAVAAALGLAPYLLRSLLDDYADVVATERTAAGQLALGTEALARLRTIAAGHAQGLSADEIRRRLAAQGGEPAPGDALLDRMELLQAELAQSERRRVEDRDRLLLALVRTQQEIQHLRYEMSGTRRSRHRGLWARLFGRG